MKYAKTILKLFTIILFLAILAYFAIEIPIATSIDFSFIKQNLGIRKTETQPPEVASITENIEEINQRTTYVNLTRARDYIQSATNDYYHGSYDEALRRLERARIYDPANYSIFKLSGQIFFEKSKFRKAFNDWERANQLSNDDKSIDRDLEVLRRLIRYSRTEIDKLQHAVNKNPNDRIARARLKELQEQMHE